MQESNDFAAWFAPIVEASGLKKKVIARRAGINPVSLSRILSGEQKGISPATAAALAQAVNDLTGRPFADVNQARRLAAGIRDEPTELNGLMAAIEKLPPDRQILAKKQIALIIESLRDENDTDYIE
ncbi:MAG: helix-turn-helix domain-containing protein [Acidobacteriota bacterium]